LTKKIIRDKNDIKKSIIMDSWEKKLKPKMMIKCPLIRKDVISSKVGQELLLYDPKTERLHVLNETAAFIWKMANGRHQVGEIAKNIKKTFSLPLKTAVELDVHQIITKLKKKGLLTYQEVNHVQG